MVGVGVSAAVSGLSRDLMIAEVLSIEEYALSLGADTISASLGVRIRYGVTLAKLYPEKPQTFLEELYAMFGATVNTVDSVPCAIAIAYYAWDVHKCALLCANLGGDTDTIGAMACGICGGIKGLAGIPSADIDLIRTANDMDLDYYGDQIILGQEVVNE